MTMIDHLERNYPENAFGGFTDIDGTILFYSRVQALLEPDSVVIDVGCGTGTFARDPVRWRRSLRVLKNSCKRVIGLDPDPRAETNPFIDEFHLVSEDTRWPLETCSADLCLVDYVLEHMTDPAHSLAEAHRVLRPGGVVCIRTVNVLSYFGLMARLTPNRMHGDLAARVQADRDADEAFPTFYRCNTTRKLGKALRSAGFDQMVVYGYHAEPSYLSFSSVLYFLGVLYQRHAPRRLGPVLFGYARRS